MAEQGTMAAGSAALCVSCGQLRPVCCDTGYTELADGTLWHDDPRCAACCDCHAARVGRGAAVPVGRGAERGE